MLRRSLIPLLISIIVASPVGAFSTVAYHQELDKAHESIKSGDYKGAYDRVSKLANQGHPCAQCLLGVMYQKGIGVKKDQAMATKWLKESANHGFPDAQNRLGHMYLNGYLIDKNTKAAEEWLTKASKQGVAQAQYNLGKMYLNFPKKAMEGRRLIRLAADQGYDEAKQSVEKVPGVKSWEAKSGGAATQTATGVHNIQESWAGYAQAVKSMDDLVQGAATAR